MRTVVIHRSDRITGPWEGRLAFQDLGVGHVIGVNGKAPIIRISRPVLFLE